MRVLLRAAHRIARQLDIGHSRSQPRSQLRVQLLAFRHRLQIVGQLEQQIDGQQLLRFEDALLLLHQFGARFGIVERAARPPAAPACGPAATPAASTAARALQQRVDAGAAGIEQTRAQFLIVANGAIRIAASASSALIRRNAALAAEDLPESRSAPASCRPRPAGTTYRGS